MKIEGFDRADKTFKLLIVVMVLVLYMLQIANQINGLLVSLYLISLLVYLYCIYYYAKTSLFSIVGMFIAYLVVFSQIGPFLQPLYYDTVGPMQEDVVELMMVFNFVVAVIFIVIGSQRKPSFNNKKENRRTTRVEHHVGGQACFVLFLIGASLIIFYFFRLGTIPLFAPDAENFRVAAIAGNGTIVLAGSAFLKCAVLMEEKPKLRAVYFAIALLLLFGVGFRSYGLSLVLLLFLIYILPKLRKNLSLSAILAILLIALFYALVGVTRSGIDWSFQSLYKVPLWRLYVNSFTLNMLFLDYPTYAFQYGFSLLNDLSVLLPGSQSTYITQLKELLGFHFAGGSMTVSIFGEGYYNWGIFGFVAWPICNILLLRAADRIFIKVFDWRYYLVISFAFAAIGATGLVPVLTNEIIPLLLAYGLLKIINSTFVRAA